MTLEQPFKDSAITPDPRFGWSPARCRRLGAATLDALAAVIGDLR
jgi:murein tripeptide amidase MpaA